MPRVPTYDGPQVAQQAQRPTYMQTPDVSRDARVAAAGLDNLAGHLDRIAERDAQTDAWNTQAKITEDFATWRAEAQKNSQGVNARGYTEAVRAWWAKASTDYGAKLSPLARQMASRALVTAQASAVEGALGYEGQQLEIGERSALNAAVTGLQGQAISAGPAKAQPILDQAVQQIRAYGARKGLDMEPEAQKIATGVHATLISQLMQTDPKAAELYFSTHKAQIDPTQWDNISGRINQVSAITDGEAKASEIWAATVKPGDYRNPVDQFALEKQMREAYPNDPTRQKAGLQALREMASAWNKAQAEQSAANTNAVYGMLDKGTSLTRVMRSNAWQALPEAEQYKIRTQMETRAAAQEQRAAVADARRDRQKLLQNGEQYLTYSDPEVLSNMTRDQVVALRSTFGFEGAQQLLNRWDTLQKRDGKLEARMDTEDFNHVADQLGMSPYEAKGEDKKRALGELKFRVEQLIDQAQQAKKSTLTRDEKMTLMRTEMSRTVTVDPGIFSRNKDVPVIQLTPDQAREVVVPDADRARIVEKMRTRYNATKDKAFEPTEANVRNWYLLGKSRSAALIPQQPTK